MLPTWVLEQMGISDPQIGMEIVLSYQIGDSYNYVSDTFLPVSYTHLCLVQHGRHHAEHRTIRYGVTDQIAAAQIKDGREIELLSHP